MSLAITSCVNTFVGNGAQTVFPLTYAFKANPDIVVQVATTPGVFVTKALGVDYTLAGAAGAEGTAAVTFISGAPANLAIIKITRKTALTQPISFPSQGEFLPAVHEAAFDREEMQIQEHDFRIATLEAAGAPVTAPASKVQNTFNVLDPPETTFPINVAVAGTPSSVILGKLEDLTDGAQIQSAGLPDTTAFVANQFTLRNFPGLIPGHQYRATWIIYTL